MTTQTQQSQLNKISIYILVDPRKPEVVRYVGQAQVPRIRHLQHCAENTKSAKGEWIESLRQQGLFPQMIIVEWTTEQMADDVERVWINRMNPEFLTNTVHNPKRLKVNQPKPQSIPMLEAAVEQSRLEDELTSHNLKEAAKQMICDALKKYDGNKKKVAQVLGIGRQTLYNKIKFYNIDCSEYGKQFVVHKTIEYK